MNQPNACLWKESIPGGCHWSGIVRRARTLRLADVTGGANAAVLYNMEEKLERYNMADTLKTQHTFRLTKGHACIPIWDAFSAVSAKILQAGMTPYAA